MAVIPLSSSSPASLNELLATLEPNVLPTEPSFWPLAFGYWLLIFTVIAAMLSVWILHRRSSVVRAGRRRLIDIQSLSSPLQQSIQVHQLLRWAAAKRAQETLSMSDKTFQHWMENTFNLELPSWFNTHYQSEPKPISWREATTLLERLLKEVKR